MRRARPGDGPQVWPLVRDFAVSTVPEQEIFERSFAGLLARPDTLVLVADEGEVILGYLLAGWQGRCSPTGPCVGRGADGRLVRPGIGGRPRPHGFG